MSIANTTICDTPSRPAPLSAVAVRPAAGLRKHLGVRAYSLPAICRAASAHIEPAVGWQVREEGEYYIPDLERYEDYGADRDLSNAVARAHSGNAGRVLGLLDDAINLVGVLLAAVEQDDDTRGAQARTVLEMTVECIHEARRRVGDCRG